MQAFNEVHSDYRQGLLSKFQLNNQKSMPWLGLGVFKMESHQETERVVLKAIETGYRSIDTAAVYGNEAGVGAAVRNCGIPRESLFITSKIWNEDIRNDRVESAFEDSMQRLGLEYVDMILLHWPINGKISVSWKALERVYAIGRVKAIGVSNYLEQHLQEVIEIAQVKPVVNQLEFHPYLQIKELRAYCESQQIRVQAWSPFMHGGGILNDPVLCEIARKHGKTTAQIILRWILENGVTTIPKTIHHPRLLENASVFDFKLDSGDHEAIATLDRNSRWGPNPADFNF